MYSLLFFALIIIHVSFWNYSLAVVPVINNLPNSTSVHEDTSTEDLLYTLDVTDADGDSITCSFGAGTNPGTGTSRFRVRYITGTTTWGIYTVAGSNYNYNSQPDYSLVIECDANGDTVDDTYTVYLTQNQAPVINNLPDNVTLSTSAAIGHNVFTVDANDTENDQITFSLTCDPVTPICPFEIFDSGAIQVNADIPTPTVTGYDVTVIVSDSSGSGTAKVLSVIFTDINNQPAIQNLNTAISVPENSVLDDNLETTTCTDADATDTLVYSMTCSPTSGSTYFQINSSSGEIKTSSSSLINYEFLLAAGSTSFTCTITCSDGEASDTATLDLDVTDVNETPTYSQNGYSISADEGTGGTVIQTTGYDVTDEDASDTKTFSLDCGTTSTGYFSINTSTGITSYATDYDVDDGVRPSSVSCNVSVTDSGGLTDTTTLSITINNLNDNAPDFTQSSYVWFISESDPVGTTVGTAAATDADIGTFGDIIYSLDQSALTAEYFEIDQTGNVIIKNSITTLGAGVTSPFYVLATDGGGNETRVTATVVITATTTPTTTTTTDRYKTFFDDERNIAWFTVCCVALVVTAVVIGWMCYSFTGGASQTMNGYSEFEFSCCKCWQEPTRHRRNWGEHHRDNFKREDPPPPERTREHVGFQFWSESYKQLD